jgi:hypothetical protein
MQLEINEEEREFIEKACRRAERLAFIGVESYRTLDLEKIIVLKNKIRALDSERIIKSTEEGE